MVKLPVSLACCLGIGLLAVCSSSARPLFGSAAGAGGAGTSLASVTSYGSANAIITTGYWDSEISADHFEVRVKGSTVTPSTWLEKIALARAAEIAISQRFKFFKAGAFADGFSCKDARQVSAKGGRSPAERAPVVAVDVVFAQQPLDAGYLAATETFERLSAELAAEAVTADAKAAAAAVVQDNCGK